MHLPNGTDVVRELLCRHADQPCALRFVCARVQSRAVVYERRLHVILERRTA